MKFHLQNANGQNLFTGYGPGYTLVNGVRLILSRTYRAVVLDRLHRQVT